MLVVSGVLPPLAGGLVLFGGASWRTLPAAVVALPGAGGLLFGAGGSAGGAGVGFGTGDG